MIFGGSPFGSVEYGGRRIRTAVVGVFGKVIKLFRNVFIESSPPRSFILTSNIQAFSVTATSESFLIKAAQNNFILTQP